MCSTPAHHYFYIFLRWSAAIPSSRVTPASQLDCGSVLNYLSMPPFNLPWLYNNTIACICHQIRERFLTTAIHPPSCHPLPAFPTVVCMLHWQPSSLYSTPSRNGLLVHYGDCTAHKAYVIEIKHCLADIAILIVFVCGQSIRLWFDYGLITNKYKAEAMVTPRHKCRRPAMVTPKSYPYP